MSKLHWTYSTLRTGYLSGSIILIIHPRRSGGIFYMWTVSKKGIKKKNLNCYLDVNGIEFVPCRWSVEQSATQL